MTSFLLTLRLAGHLRNVTAAALARDLRRPPRVFCLGTSRANRSCENARFRGLESVWEMGSDQSTSLTSDQQQRDPGIHPSQSEVSSSSVQTDSTPEPRDTLDPDTDLPQCRMGTRKVDDMSFMIACTNWY